MNTKIKSIIVLTSICLIVSALLAVTNYFTGPIIEKNEAQKEFVACYEVMPDANEFENFDFTNIANLPKSIKNIYKETSGKGYVFKMETSGYKPGLVIMCGIDANGKITNVTTVSSQETQGLGTKTEDESYTSQYVGKDKELSGINSISGATITSMAFYDAIKDAFTAYGAIKGETIIVPEPVDPYDVVMPNAVDLEDITSTIANLPSTVKKVYKETSGLGYVFEMETIGYNEGLVIVCGIDTDGKIINTATVSSNETKGLGTKTENESYTSQYVGKDANLEGVQIITGATYTSEAYQDAIKDAFVAYGLIKGEPGGEVNE